MGFDRAMCPGRGGHKQIIGVRWAWIGILAEHG